MPDNVVSSPGTGRPSGEVDVAPEPARAPSLRSLQPRFQAENHGVYVDALLKALKDDSAQPPLNIALAGGYGTGKSSVLREVCARLDSDGHKVITVSLSTLGDDADEADDDARSVARRIQKAVLQQMLYSEPAEVLRGSRFRRAEPFNGKLAIAVAAVVTVLVTAVVVAMGGAPHLLRFLWPVGELTASLTWPGIVLCLAGLGALMGGLFLAQRTAHGRIRIDKLSAASASIELGRDDDALYFDKYLDEIVFFFQQTGLEIVVFEDLDRFDNALIFDTLRELNTVLNRAARNRKIRFVYAVRDGLFDEATAHTDADDTNSKASDDAKAMPSATNRTKFFDLIVPMVPFITRRTSRDHLVTLLAPTPWKVNPELVTLVASHLTDMRLLTNICNEFEVFCSHLLAAGGIPDLSADRVFAMVVYKNTHLADFERIPNGSSTLDSLVDSYRGSLESSLAQTTNEIAAVRKKMAEAESGEAAAIVRGRLLATRLNAAYHQPNGVVVKIGGQTFQGQALETLAFWQLALSEAPVIVQSSNAQLDNNDLAALVGEDAADLEAWVELDLDDLEQAASDLEARRRAQRFMTLAEHMSAQGPLPDALQSDPLLAGLVLGGWLDANYVLYSGSYPGVAVSSNAMNYIVQFVQRDRSAVSYALTTDEIRQVRSEAPELVTSSAAFNIDIADFLLSERGDDLPHFIEHLVRELPDSDASSFARQYMERGQCPDALVKELASEWEQVFDFLGTLADSAFGAEGTVTRNGLIDAAIDGADPANLQYGTTLAVSEALEAAPTEFPCLTATEDPEDAARIAEVLHDLSVSLPSLAGLSGPVTAAIRDKGSYEVNAETLTQLIGSATWPLDAIRTTHGGSVYKHVLAHLPSYLAALEASGSLVTITADGADDVAEILTEVAAALPGLISKNESRIQQARDVAERVVTMTDPTCVVSTITEVPESLWPVLARLGRMSLSWENLAAYTEKHQVDDSLQQLLQRNAAVTDIDGTDTRRVDIAAMVINSSLDEDTKVTLSRTLAMDDLIPVAKLKKPSGALLGRLVEEQVVADDADAFRTLTASDWPNREAFIAKSEAFPTYVATFVGPKGLKSADLDLVALSDSIPAGNREALIAMVPSPYQPSKDAAEALIRLATPNNIDPDRLVALAERGASATSVMHVADMLIDVLDLAHLQAIMRALGGDYADVVGLENGKYVHLPKTDDLDAVLTSMRDKGQPIAHQKARGREAWTVTAK